MRRDAFTLIELLVVIAIITVLFALLLSAVQSVRTSAARVACANQLRQVVLATHGFHDVEGKLPAGTVAPLGQPGPPGPLRFKGPYPLLNWGARILPYLEQQSLWAEIDRASRNDPLMLQGAPEAAYARLPVYQCPGDSPRTPPDPALLYFGHTSYLGVAGTGWLHEDGVFYANSQTRFADITDGLSNTLLLGERPPSHDGLQGRYFGGWGYWGPADAYLGVEEDLLLRSTSCFSIPPPRTRYQLTDPCARYQFWSFHPGGSHFAFADCSVRFLSYGPSTLPQMATRSAGEVALSYGS